MHSGLTHSVLQSLHRAACGSAASIPTAAHAQPAARLLDKLSSLMLERCGRALLGRCLRLGARLCACLVYLAKVAFFCHQEGMASQSRVIPRPSFLLVSTSSSSPLQGPCCHMVGMYGGLVRSLSPMSFIDTGKGRGISRRMSTTSLSSSAQTCGNAVA